MSIHRSYCEQIPPQGTVLIQGEEAHHALRTKRLAQGDPLEIFDGIGTVARAHIAAIERPRKNEWAMHLQVEAHTTHPKPTPALAVHSGVPKGPRLDTLIEGLSQAGAAHWSPLLVRRSIVDPRPAKLHRLARVAIESAKQAHRPWTLTIGSRVTLAQALAQALEQALAQALEKQGTSIVLADASGAPYLPTGADAITLLVGPEGGFDPTEIETARDAGAQIACFGAHTMRIETAAPIATGIILDLAHRKAPRHDQPVSTPSPQSSVSHDGRTAP